MRRFTLAFICWSMVVASLFLPGGPLQATQRDAGLAQAGEITFGTKAPDDRLLEILNKLDEAQLDKEVAANPGKFLQDYLPVFQVVNQYDLNSLTQEQKDKVACLYNNVGTGHGRLKRYQEEIYYLKLATKVLPTDLIVLKNLGLAFKRRAKELNSKAFFLESLAVYKLILAMDPNQLTRQGREASKNIDIIKTKYLPKAK
jgi:tetratricopeptide (TPR) repeat protein